MKGMVLRIQRASLDDGPGIRTTVFLKGCPLTCPWCHNPESQPMQRSMLTYPHKCTHCGACGNVCTHNAVRDALLDDALCIRCGACASVCVTGAIEAVGQELEAEEVFRVVARDKRHYAASGGGMTVSGGEPLMQPAFTQELLSLAKESGVHTCLETSGFPAEALPPLLPLVDLWLFDCKGDAAHHEAWTGIPLDAVMASLSLLSGNGARIRLRAPLVPGINDTMEHLAHLRSLCRLPGVEGIDIMPYHRTGVSKYEALRWPYALHQVGSVSPEMLAQWEAALHTEPDA